MSGDFPAQRRACRAQFNGTDRIASGSLTFTPARWRTWNDYPAKECLAI